MAEVSERAEDGDAEAEKVRKKVEKSKTKQDVEMTVYEGAEDALADDDVVDVDPIHCKFMFSDYSFFP